MLLQAQKIRKSYFQGVEELPILKNINLEVREGEKIAIMGPSGSGKSTLLSILSCLDRADSGDLQICGQSVGRMGVPELTSFRAQHVGVIFQNFHLLEKLTAEENIQLPLDLLGKSHSQQKTKDVLKALNLDSRGKHFPYQLSRGESQRVAIGRVLVTDPQIIFADEPTGSLDLKTAQKIMDLLFQHLSPQSAFVMVTHDAGLARLCQKTYHLENGELKS